MSQWRRARTSTGSTCRSKRFLQLRNTRNTRKGSVYKPFLRDLSIALFLEKDLAIGVEPQLRPEKAIQQRPGCRFVVVIVVEVPASPEAVARG